MKKFLIGLLLLLATAAQAQYNKGPQFPVAGSYTPTITSASGTITTSSVTFARYVAVGSNYTVSLEILITTNGTGAGSIRITSPFTLEAGQSGTCNGRERGISGTTLHGYIAPSASFFSVYKFDGTYPGVNGAVLSLTCHIG